MTRRLLLKLLGGLVAVPATAWAVVRQKPERWISSWDDPRLLGSPGPTYIRDRSNPGMVHVAKWEGKIDRWIIDSELPEGIPIEQMKAWTWYDESPHSADWWKRIVLK